MANIATVTVEQINGGTALATPLKMSITREMLAAPITSITPGSAAAKAKIYVKTRPNSLSDPDEWICTEIQSVVVTALA